MEFNEKLKELRKRKGLTQEELAQALYVSRTAVSKWESGRGYPSIDSLKAVAKLFSVTVDDLISGDELLNVAEEDSKQKQTRLQDMVFGLLDLSALLLLFLPFFGMKSGGDVSSVSLLSLSMAESYMRVAYLVSVIVITLSGILTLALQNCNKTVWIRNKSKISLELNAIGTLLFIISPQPYAAAYLFVFLMIKAIMLIKWR